MRFAGSGLWFLSLAAWAGTYAVPEKGAGAWPRIFSSVNLQQTDASRARVVVNPEALREGAIYILEGDTPLARSLGFVPQGDASLIRNVIDERAPGLQIIWQEAVRLPQFTVPSEATVFVRDRWRKYPLMAGFRRGTGAVLWLAAPPGIQGFERFPYLLHALCDLGLELPFESRRLWAFFDWSYRTRVDLDYFAARWRRAGIAALQVASWHFMEADAERDAYLARLIEACHRQSILVYAWIELPHVSESFWHEHPEWRERTALGQDAHLDWRKLMNLSNRDCSAEVARRVDGLVRRFDWDGVNLAELYFESLEGYSNAARFTPMNADIRSAFQREKGFDPLELFDETSRRHPSRSARPMRDFLNFRVNLAYQLQTEWIARLEEIRKRKPHLDLVLTHVDDRLDSTIRDTIGADSTKILPYAQGRGITFLAEDPATVWDRGPQRYTELAQAYAGLSRDDDLLAIDINIVERYQDVYPTRQQTGAELFQLVHFASNAFARVALYFENSLEVPDLAILPAAGSVIQAADLSGDVWIVDAPQGAGVRRRGNVARNGALWPVRDGDIVWLPSGKSSLKSADREPPIHLVDLNATLIGASVRDDGIEFDYRAPARALARFDREVEIRVGELKLGPAITFLLPAGEYRVIVRTAGLISRSEPDRLPEAH